jgi:hypothetical protein
MNFLYLSKRSINIMSNRDYKKEAINLIVELEETANKLDPELTESHKERYGLWIKQLEQDFICADGAQWLVTKAHWMKDKDKSLADYIYTLCNEKEWIAERDFD